jgi:hypothetical protein
MNAQKEFHVFPENHKITPGTITGNGSLQNPWNLQTALQQKSNVVNGGDTIWLHQGVYNGRYKSTLNSTLKNHYIIVTPFNNEKVVLNGNVNSAQKQVLSVVGNNVIFKNFEITWLNSFTRYQTEKNFIRCDGINHNSGKNVKFINLIIHTNPGSGIGSWRKTSNAEINGCIIFNNGFYSTKRGRGVGIYVQNSSDKTRLIKNNIIFNNYYKGIEIWSDNRKAKSDYVKNILLDNNVFFNSGLVSGTFRDNLIIATNDNSGNNIAKNITVKNNIFYHNTSLSKTIENTSAPSLTLGFNKNAPVEDVIISNNIIIGRKDAIRILEVKSLSFKNNIVYSGYIRLRKSVLKYISNKTWKFSNNTYYTRNDKPIRIEGVKDYSINQWKTKYELESQSKYKNFKEFDLNNVLNITKNDYKQNTFRVVLFNKYENDVTVNFLDYNLIKGMTYTIKDVENYDTTLKSGILSETLKVKFPMQLKRNKNKTFNNFGVYIIEFSETETIVKKEGFFKRLFGWLF